MNLSDPLFRAIFEMMFSKSLILKWDITVRWDTRTSINVAISKSKHHDDSSCLRLYHVKFKTWMKLKRWRLISCILSKFRRARSQSERDWWRSMLSIVITRDYSIHSCLSKRYFSAPSSLKQSWLNSNRKREREKAMCSSLCKLWFILLFKVICHGKTMKISEYN